MFMTDRRKERKDAAVKEALERHQVSNGRISKVFHYLWDRLCHADHLLEVSSRVKEQSLIVIAHRVLEKSAQGSTQRYQNSSEKWIQEEFIKPVLLINVGPSIFRNLSEFCLKTVRNLSVAKKLSEMWLKCVRYVSEICQIQKCGTILSDQIWKSVRKVSNVKNDINQRTDFWHLSVRIQKHFQETFYKHIW